jgi:DNA-binding transcriptional regulator YiaG
MTPDELKAWREARGLSQSGLARLLPAPLRTVQEWEAARGKGKPPKYLARALRDLHRELQEGANA